MPTLYENSGILTDRAMIWPSARSRHAALVATGEPSECWPWTGRLDRYGYGYFAAQQDRVRLRTTAHRVAYLLARGSIDAGLVLDHLCRNRTCCNPDHLEAVSNGENIRRGSVVGQRSVCKQGHDITSDQSVYDPNGRRRCRMCQAAYIKQWRATHPRHPSRRT